MAYGATRAATLARSVEANLTDFHIFMSEWPGIELHQHEQLTQTVSRRRFSLCNVILEARFDPTNLEPQLEKALQPYLGTNVNLMWKLGPSTQPANLGDRLVEHRFLIRPTLKGMALDLASLAGAGSLPSEFSVQVVGDLESLDLWRCAVRDGFGWPSYGADDLTDNLGYLLTSSRRQSFEAYVGIVRGDPVASSLVFFGAGVAGIYHVSTAPAQRGRGIGSAITRAPLVEARRRGYKVAILHATEMGFPVYRKLGFETVCEVAMRLRLAES